MHFGSFESFCKHDLTSDCDPDLGHGNVIYHLNYHFMKLCFNCCLAMFLDIKEKGNDLVPLIMTMGEGTCILCLAYFLLCFTFL